MQNTCYWRILLRKAKRIMGMLWFKIATLTVTSAVSFAGSLSALRREDFSSWVIAMLIVLVLEACYIGTLGIAYQRHLATQKTMMRAATARYQAHKANASSVSSRTD